MSGPGSLMSPKGTLWLERITLWVIPMALLNLVRACSSATGLRFCGMTELPCTRPSSRLSSPREAQNSMSCSTRDSVVEVMVITLATSTCQSLALTAS